MESHNQNKKKELTEKWETHTQSAKAAVGKVKRNDLVEMKTYPSPPEIT